MMKTLWIGLIEW